MTVPLTEAYRLLAIPAGSDFVTADAAFASKAEQLAARIVAASSAERPGLLAEWSALADAQAAVASMASAGSITDSDQGASAGRDPRGSVEQRPTKPTPDGREKAWWPTPLTVDDVRGPLRDYAQRTRGTPDDAFDGELTVRDGSLARFRLRWLTEKRVEEPETVAGHSPRSLRGSYSGSLDAVGLPAPTGFGPVDWELLKDGSVATITCPHCVQGRSTCRSCGGGGTVSCRATVSCDACDSSGTVRSIPSDYTSPMVACPKCGGTHQISCPICGGSGRATCEICGGRGDVQCTECKGSAALTSYVVGVIERRPHDQMVGPLDRDHPAHRVLKHTSPRVDTLRGKSVPQGLDELRTKEVTAVLYQRPGEISRQLEIEVQPITVVGYRGPVGVDEEAYVVGLPPSVEVVAPALKKRHQKTVAKRIGVVLGSLLLVAGVVAAVTTIAATDDGEGASGELPPSLGTATDDAPTGDDATGSAGTAAPTTADPAPGESRQPVLLHSDGAVGDLPLGRPKTQVISALSRRFGEPSIDQQSVCLDRTWIGWGGLVLEFGPGPEEPLVGYRMNDDQALTAPYESSGTVDNVEAATPEGVTVGDPVTDLVDAYGPADLPGNNRFGVEVEGGLYFGWISEPAGGEITVISAGQLCGNF